MSNDEVEEYTDSQRRTSRIVRRGLLGICVLAVVHTLSFLIMDGYRSRTYVAAPAVVTDVGVAVYDKRPEPRVAYRYEVGGQTLEGSRFQLGFPLLYNTVSAERAVSGYDQGDSVTVYVDPRDPTASVLHREINLLWALGTPAVLVALGSICLFFNIWLARNSGMLRPSESWL